MPARTVARKKKRLKKRAKESAKKLKRGVRRLLPGGRAPEHARKKPEVAQADGAPGLVPMLFFSDLEKAIFFFTVKLGFDLAYQRYAFHGYTGLCAVQYPGVMLLLGPAESLEPARKKVFDENARGIGITFVITVMNVDAMYQEFKARGVVMAGEPTVQLWGTKDFSLSDPLEGYHFTFSQPVAP